VFIDDIRADFADMVWKVLSLLALLALPVIGLMAFVGGGISDRIRRVSFKMKALADGDLAVQLPEARYGDEIGEMARTVEIFRDTMLDAQRNRSEQEASKLVVAEARRTDMRRLADEFEQAVGSIVDTVSTAAELEASASGLSATAERSQYLAMTVTSASREASSNVQSVASATEEMASSVNEISRQVQQSAMIAEEPVNQASLTDARIAALAKAATRIGDVVELINNIAGQTNLLALNATIEAAGAGDADRGFAVVAAEVKALADQTAKATGEISMQVAGIQEATEGSVVSIKEITVTIGRISEIATTIASAVEEQGAATQEISRNVQQAAAGTMQVTSTAGRPSVRTALRMSTICRLPSSAPASLRRMRSIAAGSTQSLKGAPLRKAPGLRASTGT
jgi:methyl-accepting chemotaxis protein